MTHASTFKEIYQKMYQFQFIYKITALIDVWEIRRRNIQKNICKTFLFPCYVKHKMRLSKPKEFGLDVKEIFVTQNDFIIV